MPSQWVTIIRIGGVSAGHVAGRFRVWSEARTTNDPNEWDPAQWPAHVHAEVADLVRQLEEHATRPPVLYYCRYVDLWSSGLVFDNLYLPRTLQVCSPKIEVYCHVLNRSDTSILDAVKKHLRRRHFANESRWFLQRVREALDAWDEISPDGVIVVIREIVGPLIEDRAIEQSLFEPFG